MLNFTLFRNRHLILTMVLTIFCLTLNNANSNEGFNANDGWKWLNPLPFGGNFNHAEINKQNEIFIAGDYGVIVKSENSGLEWKQQSVPGRLDRNIRKIKMVPNSHIGFAISEFLLKTENNGETWEIVDSIYIYENISLYHDTLFINCKDHGDDVHIFRYDESSDELVIVQVSQDLSEHTLSWPYTYNQGIKTEDSWLWQPYKYGKAVTAHQLDLFEESPITIFNYTHYQNMIFNAEITDSTVLISYNIIGGTSGWQINHPNAYIGLMNQQGYRIIDNNDITNFISYGLNSPDGNISYLYGNRQIMRTQISGGNVENLGFLNYEVNHIDFDGTTFGVAACDSFQILLTVNSGNLWTPTIQRKNEMDYISGMLRARNGNIYAFAGYWQNQPIQKRYVRVYESEDNGISWERIYSYSGLDLITFNNFKRGHISSQNDDIYMLYANKLFKAQKGSPNIALEEIETNVRDFYFTEMERGYLIDFNNELYIKEAGENNWEKKFDFNTIGAPTLGTVFFLNENYGFVAGEQGKILKTEDGGNSWGDISVAGVTINNLIFTSPDTGFVIGNSGTFFRTVTGGSMWIPTALETNDHLFDLQFYDGMNGFIVIPNGVLATNDGGSSFQLVNSPLRLPMAHTQRTSAVIGDVSDYNLLLYGQGQNVLKLGNLGAGGNTDIFPENENNLNFKEKLFYNYPNPFSNNTHVVFYLSSGSHTRIELLDITGKSVKLILDKYQDKGLHEIILDGSGLKNGVYIIQLKTQDFYINRKIIHQIHE